ncbi:unnamed protein product [Polarella glacialis]|uniref:Uncharacterized protein n=1 Tax=Polarella glacialis TaxID=89957 RepID=A0A813K6L1_POLGL|nr:unnamed protein product [Polarella glacialis]CAE8698507.1 unnamed protein product [Polarella glacialis]CAE8735965.1 unnamed protein product [Polarella glacialis]
MIGPGGSASGCSDRSYVADQPIVIGACYPRQDNTGFVGLKAACDGQKVVMNKYAALDCSGAGTEFFTFGGACAQGFNKNGYLAIESGCGYPGGSLVSRCGMIALPNFLALTWLLVRCLV